MAVNTRITDKNPRTGALPSEQTAENQSKAEFQGKSGVGLTESDKLIYQLVENNVSYAGDQFSENLRFNSETLTNVLYENIYDLIGDKVQEDEFVNWVAEELLKSGSVVKSEPTKSSESEKQEPKEETVYELDDSQYRELISKVDASVKLIKANKLNLFKLFSQTEQDIKDFSSEDNTAAKKDELALMNLRDEQISSLVRKIQGNQKTIEDYIQSQEDNKQELEDKFQEIQDRMDTYIEDREKSISDNRKILDEIRKTLARLVKTSSELERKSIEQSKKTSSQPPSPSKAQKKQEKKQTSSPSASEPAKPVGVQAKGGQKVFPKPQLKPLPTVKKKSSSESEKKSPVSVKSITGLLKEPRVLEQQKEVPPKTVENVIGGEGEEKKPLPGIPEKTPGKLSGKTIANIAKKVNSSWKKPSATGEVQKKKSNPVVPKASIVSTLKPLKQGQVVSPVAQTVQKEVFKYLPSARQQVVAHGKTNIVAENQPIYPSQVGMGIETPVQKRVFSPPSRNISSIPRKPAPKMGKAGSVGRKPFISPTRQRPVAQKTSDVVGKTRGNLVKPLVLKQKLKQVSVPSQKVSRSGSVSPALGTVSIATGKRDLPKPLQKYVQPDGRKTKGSSKFLDVIKEKVAKISNKLTSRKPDARIESTAKASVPKAGVQKQVGKAKAFLQPRRNLPVVGRSHAVGGVSVKARPLSPVKPMVGMKPQSLKGGVDAPAPVKTSDRKITGFGASARMAMGGGGGAPPAPPPKPPSGGGGWLNRKRGGGLSRGVLGVSSAQKPSDEQEKQKDDRKKKKQQPALGKPKRPGLIRRTASRISRGVVSAKNRVAGAVSRSPVGSAYRAAKKVVGVIGKAVSAAFKVVKTVVKVVATTVKVMWKTVKFAATAFIKASAIVGGAVRGAFRGVGKMISGFMNSVSKKGIVRAVLDLTGAKLVTKLGWRLIKWGVRKLWGWIKAAAIGVAGMFKRLFKFKGKFKNTSKFYLGHLLNGVKDKAYRFIGKPIAGMLQAVFSFVGPLVMSPVKFIQWAVPSLIERFRNTLSDIRSASIDLFKSTWSIFKRILFNPITLILLIGGLVYFFWPKIVEWFKGGLISLGKGIISTVLTWVGRIWDFAKKIWDIIVPIAVTIKDFVAWITDPEGWVVQIVGTIINTIGAIKNVIKKVMGFAGYDSLDFTCMWLAGDTIGLALAMIEGLCIKAWQWASNQPFIRKIIAMIKALVKAKKLISDLPGVLWESFGKAAWDLISGNWSKISDDFCRPWREWWGAIKNAMDNNMPYDEKYEQNRVKVYDSASKTSRKTKQSVIIGTRSLKMKGMYAENNLKYMDSISQTTNSMVNRNVLNRIEHMSNLYLSNVDSVENYEDFIKYVWSEGNGNDEKAETMIKVLLESPVLSQRLMTSFFYYNPQTGQVMSMRPASYIGQFIQNIRALVGANENRDNVGVLKTIVMAFEQMNEEKWRIVEEQGRVINDFIGKVYRINLSDQKDSQRNQAVLRNLTRTFNRGDMFSGIRVQQSFEQFQKRDSITGEMKSKATGEAYGNNKLLEVKLMQPPSSNRRDNILDTSVSEYVVDTSRPKKDTSKRQTQFGNINIGEDISPFDSEDEVKKQKLSREQMFQKFRDYERKRQDKVAELNSVEKAANAGYEYLTFDQFIKRYENTVNTQQQIAENQVQAERERTKKMAGLRIVKGIQDWQNMGKEMTGDEKIMSVGGKDSGAIWNIDTDGIEQDLYMFSPEWKKIIGRTKGYESHMQTLLSEGGTNLKKFVGEGGTYNDDGEWSEFRDNVETEDERLDREEKEQEEREKDVMDYSARVNNGYIEVKVQEDEQEIMEEWDQNQRIYREAKTKMSKEEMEKRNIRSYQTYNEWIVHWRKTHGHPLDGIRRYKFEAKPVEHKVEFSVRKALTLDELKSYGVQASENGPVMIPTDKAMEIAKSLFATAKSIYSVRDGLEVMKMGIDNENSELKKRNKGKIPIAAVGIPVPVGQNGVQIQGPEKQAQAS